MKPVPKKVQTKLLLDVADATKLLGVSETRMLEILGITRIKAETKQWKYVKKPEGGNQ